jgi:hypothetical protein
MVSVAKTEKEVVSVGIWDMGRIATENIFSASRFLLTRM